MLPGTTNTLRMAGGVGVVPGSSNYSTAGSYSFTVQPYNTLVVDCQGAKGNDGATDSTGNIPPYFLTCTGGAGGTGGRAQKTWTAGSAGAPAVGASITVTVQAKGAGGATATSFASSTAVQAFTGVNGQNGTYNVPGGDAGSPTCTGGGAGAAGVGTGGDTNTTGGSGQTAQGYVGISWS